MKPLDYDRTSFRLSQRQWRTLMALTLLNTVLLGWFVVGPQGSQFLKAQWQAYQERKAAQAAQQKVIAAQKQMLTLALPAELVIVDEEPQNAKRLLAGSSGEYRPLNVETGVSAMFSASWFFDPTAIRSVMPAGAKGFTFDGASGRMPIVYSGERTTPSGKKKLLVVQYRVRQILNTSTTDTEDTVSLDCARAIHACVFDIVQPTGKPAARADSIELVLPPGRAKRALAKTPWRFEPDVTFTLFAGQPDPSDKSRVTIPYRVNGKAGVIDAQLTETDVVLKPREGVRLPSSSTPHWDIAPKAATTAATRTN